MASPFPFARPKAQQGQIERPSSPPPLAAPPVPPKTVPLVAPAPTKPDPNPTNPSAPGQPSNLIFVHLVLTSCPEIANLNKPFEKVLRLPAPTTLVEVMEAFLPELAQFGLSRYDESMFSLQLPSSLKLGGRKASEREKDKVKKEKKSPLLPHTTRLSDLPANLSHGVPELSLCVQCSPELIRLHLSSSRFGEEDTIDWVLDSPSPYQPSASPLATAPGPTPTSLLSNPSGVAGDLLLSPSNSDAPALLASVLTHPLFITCTPEQLPTVLSSRPNGEMVLRLSDRVKDAAPHLPAN